MEQQKEPTTYKLTLEQRSRSVPYKRPFVSAVVSTLLFWLSIIGFLTAATTFFMVPADMRRTAAYLFAVMLILCGLLWAISYFKRRKATCPLCKCTPFLDNLALKHQKAFRVKPFNHGTTAVFNVLLTQRWRCMYCGTPFDILKKKK